MFARSRFIERISSVLTTGSTSILHLKEFISIEVQLKRLLIRIVVLINHLVLQHRVFVPNLFLDLFIKEPHGNECIFDFLLPFATSVITVAVVRGDLGVSALLLGGFSFKDVREARRVALLARTKHFSNLLISI